MGGDQLLERWVFGEMQPSVDTKLPWQVWGFGEVCPMGQDEGAAGWGWQATWWLKLEFGLVSR